MAMIYLDMAIPSNFEYQFPQQRSWTSMLLQDNLERKTTVCSKHNMLFMVVYSISMAAAVNSKFHQLWPNNLVSFCPQPLSLHALTMQALAFLCNWQDYFLTSPVCYRPAFDLTQGLFLFCTVSISSIIFSHVCC